MKYVVYIIRTKNNNLYIEHTNDLNRREIEHKNFHNGAKFIKDNGSRFDEVYIEEFSTRAEAMKREKQLKGRKRAKKEALVIGDLEWLKKL